jgi:hypothetical protein
MNYTGQTPDEIPNENPSAKKLLTVLDGVEDYKQSEIDLALRFYRPPVNFNLAWMRKQLVQTYGFPTIPADFPKDVLDALMLCARDINALRGSKIGLELWLWCLTFGANVIDDTNFYPLPQYLQLDTVDLSYLDQFTPNVATNPPAIPDLFLFDDVSQMGQTVLSIDINSKYYNHPSIPLYITTHIKKYLGFVTSNASITINFGIGIYNPHTFPYQKFVAQ